MFYGLDWIATVPPTLALANRAFGSQKAPVMFGWIAASHQMGAAAAAFLAGLSRSATGSYLESFVAAGFVGCGGRPGGADDRARTERGSRCRQGLARSGQAF